MTYCFHPNCQHPQNADDAQVCQSCGSPLKLRGRYRVLEPWGQGGFGKTFLAIDEDRLGTRCVIKQFSPQIQGTKALDKAIQLFEQEAVRLHDLGEHPHIPALLAYFEQDQRLYLVQQFIEGSTLAQEVRQQGSFSELKIREILARLLPILKFVHDRNVIHRDITPSNIIRRKVDSRLVLIDFGVAKLLTETTSSQPGTRIGTEGYAPIEQLRNGKAYPASDLYSLGATCLYLLTHVRPEELHDPLSGRWLWRERLAERGTGLSEGIGRILDKMLRDLVSDRYQTADEVMHDLRIALNTPPIVSTPCSHHSPSSEQLLIGALPATQFPSGVPRSHPSKNHGSEKPPTSPPKSKPSRPLISDIPQPRNCLITLTGHSSWVMSIAFHPTGKMLISGSLDDRIMIWDLVIGDRLGTLTAHTKSVNTLAFSPDGQTFLSGSDDDTIKHWQFPSGSLIRSLSGHTRDVNSVATSPDGQYFVSGSEDRTVCLWRLKTGELLRNYTDALSGMVRSVAISPNGQVLVSGGLDNQIRLWNLNTGQHIRTLTGHQNSVLSIAITPDGNKLVSSSKDRTIRIWNPNTGELLQTLTGHSDIINSIAISPDGKTLISGSNDYTIKLWNLANGEPLCTLTEHTHAVNAIAISSDGTQFASGSSDNTIKVWQFSA
jgi:WD40 repeat protein